MKWGRKKASPPSSSSPISAITRAFPFPWFSKSKKKGGSFDQSDSKKKKQRCGPEFSTPKSCNWREGRFYSMDEDESFWRLSFSDERKHGRKSTGGINPLWYDHDHNHHNHHNHHRRDDHDDHDHGFSKDECRNFSDMVLDVKKMRENRGNRGNRGKQSVTPEKKAGVSTRRRRDMDEQVSRRSNKEEKNVNSYERDVFPIETEEGSVSEWLDFEGRKLKELKIKTESKRKNRGGGIKPCSPRTECKIKALEELKKSRTKKTRTKTKEKVLEGNTVFDSFAVLKSSYDPQRDFRDSMIEMIRERGIGHPQDLEELLACYLTLNRDEYHDLIINVFRQVWFELKGVYIDPNGSIFGY